MSDTQRPENIKANRIPPDGFLLSVDGKFKARYETAEAATNAGEKLKMNFPVVQVAVFDAITKTLTPVELSDKA